jgi:hypothetical protein
MSENMHIKIENTSPSPPDYYAGDYLPPDYAADE